MSTIRPPYEPYEKAKKDLMTKDINVIRSQIQNKSNIYLSTITNYFLAIEGIDISLLRKELTLDVNKSKKFKKNKKFLLDLRKQIWSNPIRTNLGSYSLGFILGGLISLLREFEANIIEYNNYLEVASKIRELEEDCKSEKFLEDIWKKTIESIDEILDYLEMKSKSFYPTIEKILIDLKQSSDRENNSSKIIIGGIKEYHDEREGFYLLSNIIQINPILFNKYKSFCEKQDLNPNSIHRLFIKSLKPYQDAIEDKRVKHLVGLFLKNPRFQIT